MSFTVLNFSENQADCFLIVLENKKQEQITILVDGNKENSNYQKVMYVISQKYQKLDYIVVSHVDDDHLGGIIKMLEDVNWKCAEKTKILYNYVVKKNVSYEQAKRFEDLIAGRTVISSEKDNFFSEDRYLRILSEDYRKVCMEVESKPDKAFLTLIKPKHFNMARTRSDCTNVLNNNKKPNSKLINKNSFVFLLEFEGKSAVFTGDANWDQIESSLNNTLGQDYVLDLIKIPHHGAKVNNKKMVEYAIKHKTKYFLVSGKEKWDKKHPDEELMDDITNRCFNAKVYTLIQDIPWENIVTEEELRIEK